MSTEDGGPDGSLAPEGLGSRSLRRNMFFAVTGMGVFQACQFGVIVLLAKFSPTEVLGQVQYSLAVATPIILFLSLELRGALIADAGSEFTFGTYRALRQQTSAVATVLLLGGTIWEYATNRNLAFALIFAGMCATRVVLALAEISWGLFQKRERVDLMAASASMRGVSLIIPFGVALPVYWLMNQRGWIAVEQLAFAPVIAIGVYLVASVSILLFFDRKLAARRVQGDVAWTWADVGRLAKRTFPLGLTLLVLHLCNSIPQLAIEWGPGGKTALGHFGALATVTIAGNLFIFQAANAAANRVAAYYVSDFGAFLRLAGKLLAMAVGIGVLILAVALPLAPWLLRILYRAEYAVYADEFRIIVAAQCLALLTNVFGVLVTQMRLFWLQVPAQVLVLIVTLTAALLLIPGADNAVRAGAWTITIRSIVHAGLYLICFIVGVAFRPYWLRWQAARRAPPSVETDDTQAAW